MDVGILSTTPAHLLVVNLDYNVLVVPELIDLVLEVGLVLKD